MIRRSMPFLAILLVGLAAGALGANYWSSLQQRVAAGAGGAGPTGDQDVFKGKVGKTILDSTEYWPPAQKPPKGAPNVLVWLIDDCGYGHVSSFGGLVPTPNIDKVAKRGLRYSNFHTTALCSPTRAAILAGRNHHAIGLGSHSLSAMGFPGYNAHVPPSARGFPRILQMFGWVTFMIGKWDHTPQWESTMAGPFDRWPIREGFDHFYGFMSADMNNYSPIMWSGTTPVQPAIGNPKYHISEDMADKAIEQITGYKASAPDRPFCMFWATPAVHAPHQAPKEWLEKFRGKYDMGWDKAREMILENQIKQGIAPEGTKLFPRDKEIPAWDTLDQKAKELYARQMEAFAAQLHHADHHFGRILAKLEEMGELDNTLIMITSDNGASGEGGPHGTFNENGAFNGVTTIPVDVNRKFLEQWGDQTGIWHYAAGWALAGNTPFGWWKQSSFRGGNSDPLVISWPKKIQEKQWGMVRRQYHHIIDVSPTILEACGVESPKVIDGVKQLPIDGIAMNYSFNEPDAKDRRTLQYYELFGNRALYKDGWIAVTQHRERRPWDLENIQKPFEDDVWYLYNLMEDFSQANDLAAKHPEKLKELQAAWDGEAKKYNVYPLDANIIKRTMAMQAMFSPKLKEFVYYPGGTRVHESISPNVKNRSHALIAEVVIPPEGAEGMLVTAGGRTSGYGLYVKDKHLVYTYNFLGLERYTAKSSKEVPAGACTLSFKFTKTGNFAGKGALFINDEKVGEVDMPRTIPGTFSIEETFDVGEDTGGPVIEGVYSAPFRFTGQLKKLRVTLDD